MKISLIFFINMKELDTNLYSRQILTYGLDTMRTIIEMKILVIGLRGLGIEIAKNLILSGPKEVSISDKKICTINDLGSNFFISEDDINKKTLEDSCFKKLKELNPNVDNNIFTSLDNINLNCVLGTKKIKYIIVF